MIGTAPREWINENHVEFFEISDFIDKIKLSDKVLNHVESTSSEFEKYLEELAYFSEYDDYTMMYYWLDAAKKELRQSIKVEGNSYGNIELLENDLFFYKMSISKERIKAIHRFVCESSEVNINNPGEFRKKEDSANKKYMEEVEKGYIPNELVKKGITDLGIEMDDQRDKNYEPPKEEKKFHAFTGAGKSVSTVNTQGLHVDKNATSNVDKSKPTCKVNIRLFNGEVVSEDFNLTQTLQDVINFVRKKSGSNNFSLLDGFPPRPITTYNKTIQELHLEGSLLTQKIN